MQCVCRLCNATCLKFLQRGATQSDVFVGFAMQCDAVPCVCRFCNAKRLQFLQFNLFAGFAMLCNSMRSRCFDCNALAGFAKQRACRFRQLCNALRACTFATFQCNAYLHFFATLQCNARLLFFFFSPQLCNAMPVCLFFFATLPGPLQLCIAPATWAGSAESVQPSPECGLSFLQNSGRCFWNHPWSQLQNSRWQRQCGTLLFPQIALSALFLPKIGGFCVI